MINGTVINHDIMGCGKQEGPNEYFTHVVMTKPMIYNMNGDEQLYFVLTGVFKSTDTIYLEVHTSIYIQKIS